VRRLKLKVLMVGKIKERYLQEGIREYLKRLGPYARVELHHVAEEPAVDPSPAQAEQARTREGERLLRAMEDYVVTLDQRGEQLSSEEIAQLLHVRALHGQPQITFVIGGSTGLAPAVLQKSHMTLSFGRLTYLHQMMPLLLLEQLYRAFKINQGEPYHK
jgi:23S rRNA (pseudouridine1915-N3)-methyltransferase